MTAATMSPSAGGSRQSIRRHILAGAALAVVLVAGVGGWAATSNLAGAVIAAGSVVVEANLKKVQHPTGGVVGEIRVRDGSPVKAGDILVRLDETITRANLAVVVKSLDELQGRRARLEAERDGAGEVVFPDAFSARIANEPDVAKIAQGERNLFDARRSARVGQKAQLRERIDQLRQEIIGLEAQKDAKSIEIDLIREELKGVEDLFAKNLVPMNRVTAMRREAARLNGERGQVTASMAQARGKIAEIELQTIQIEQDLRTEVARDLREVEAKWGEFVERKVSAEDQLKRVDIRSPQDGVVHQLNVHTVGGVIGPAETLMLIVPQAEKLIIEAKVAPQDIDQVSVGQTALVRLSAFNQRTTPELFGTVGTVSADLTREPPGQQPAQAYYTARIELPETELARLKGLKLLPGMPIEAHIQTGDRLALSYFVKPLSDQIAKAFKEE